MLETELIISGIDFPPYSSRGCQQTLSPIGMDNMRRTINGTLRYLGHQNFHKYCTIIECQDIHGPAFNHMWLGSAVEVACCQYIWQKVEAGLHEIQLIRRARPETLQITDSLNQPITFTCEEGQKVTFTEPLNHSVMIKFMPILTMRLTGFNQSHHEWNQTTTWRLELEEI